MKTLILGGVRSGKSRLAETMALKSKLPVVYIATATVGDDEMRARIEAHRVRRPGNWTVIEEPLLLAATLQTQGTQSCFVIVDCLTLWLTNLLMMANEKQLEHEREALLTVLPTLHANIALVSNETGMGVTPMGELTRRYCDEAGRLHQELAQRCNRVVLTIAGLPTVLKGEPL